ncbi:MAG: hypothetical protein WCO06_06125 [Candidatus Roizmanbacteria bacterium]
MAKLYIPTLFLPVTVLASFCVFFLGIGFIFLNPNNTNPQVLGTHNKEFSYSHSFAQATKNQPLGQHPEKEIKLYMIDPKSTSCKAEVVIKHIFRPSNQVKESLKLLENVSSLISPNQTYINGLRDKNITISSVTVESSMAFVTLLSKTPITNECELNKIKSQIYQTVIQFSDILLVHISLNGNTL